jgi:predicted PurR-regulated permease PerM
MTSVAKKPIMSLGAINTILNTAPILIQGASKLIKLISEQGKDNKPEAEIPDTIDGIKNEVDRLHQRLDADNKANVEQTKLIEELAKQNESLAAQLKKTMTHLNRFALLSVAAIIIALFCLVYLLQ